MELELYKLDAEENMQKALSSYKNNLTKISAGRANPAILESVQVNYYEVMTPINQIASISVPEAKQLLIKPFDISTTKEIVNAINKASLGVNAIDEGDKARINFPEITTERRKDLVKSLSNYTEQAKIQVRSARQNANKQIKLDKELSEDDQRFYQDEIQKLTDKYIVSIDKVTKNKESDLMTI